MILIFLFFGAALFTWTMIFMRPSLKKNIWVIVALILTLGSLGLIIGNYHSHLGMKVETTEINYPLTSSVKNKQILLYKQLGTKNERVYLYKTNPLDDKLSKTNPFKSHVIIQQNQKKNQLTVLSHYWVYRNEETRLLFSIGERNHQLINKTLKFQLQPHWQIQKIN